MSHSFHRGSLALDFVGTVGSRTSPKPEERLASPGDLARWLAEAGLADGTSPTAAELARARTLREAIHAAAEDALHGRAIGRDALATINRSARGLRRGVPQLTPSRSARWVGDAPLPLALARVAADAIEVLSRQADHLTRCELEGCGALLLSRSRGEPRRWCSMQTCGNRAKAAAFRRRRRDP